MRSLVETRHNSVMENLDKLDLAVLAELQRDGRMTSADLAERVGLSASATLRRVRRLEESGVIDRYVMLVNPDAVGRSVSVFVELSLDSQAEELLEEFETAVRDAPQVMSCHLMAGDYDYRVHVMCKDVAGYEEVHQYLAGLPHVANLRSNFAIREVCARTELQLTEVAP